MISGYLAEQITAAGKSILRIRSVNQEGVCDVKYRIFWLIFYIITINLNYYPPLLIYGQYRGIVDTRTNSKSDVLWAITSSPAPPTSMPRLWRSEAPPCTTTTSHTWVPHWGWPLYPDQMDCTAWRPLNISQALTRKMALKRVRPIVMRSNGAQVAQRHKNPRWTQATAICVSLKLHTRLMAGSSPAQPQSG